MIDRVWKDLGPLSTSEHAGIETIVPFLDLTDEQWTRLVDVNLREMVCFASVCRRVVAEGRKGSIVNIGSIQRPRFSLDVRIYAPAKLAIEALTPTCPRK